MVDANLLNGGQTLPHLEVVLVDGHLKVQPGELAQVAVRVAVLSPAASLRQNSKGWEEIRPDLTPELCSVGISVAHACLSCARASASHKRQRLRLYQSNMLLTQVVAPIQSQ
jgi:hypothetical protein